MGNPNKIKMGLLEERDSKSNCYLSNSTRVSSISEKLMKTLFEI